MVKRSEIFDFAENKYNAKPDYPFEKYRHYAVLRHTDDDKWFGLVMNVSREKLGLKGEGEADVLDIKCHPAKVDDLKTKPGFRAAGRPEVQDSRRARSLPSACQNPFPRSGNAAGSRLPHPEG